MTNKLILGTVSLCLLFAVAWKDQWKDFLKCLTKPCEEGLRSVIDPSMMRAWFQGVLTKSGLEKLEDEDVASVSLILNGQYAIPPLPDMHTLIGQIDLQ